jgi:hypothetical protein
MVQSAQFADRRARHAPPASIGGMLIVVGCPCLPGEPA